MNDETNYFLSKNDFQCFFYLDFAKCDCAVCQNVFLDLDRMAGRG